MKRFSFVLGAVWVAVAFTGIGCTATSTEEGPRADLTRDEARALGGKLDGFDLCEWLGWYDDGVCDEFCLEPDPDCEAECRDDSDCPTIYCITSPCPQLVCEANECVIDIDPDDRCGAGERECSTCTGAYICMDDSVSCPHFECPPTCESNDDCEDDRFCDFDEGTCGGIGHCMNEPTVCTREFMPVCGCDGETYSNDCQARASGTSVAHDGPCEVECTADTDCAQPSCLPGGPCFTNVCVDGECVRDEPECRPVLCELYCPYGFETDDAGCDICSCAPPPEPECPAVLCALYCPFGFETNEDGCETCSCAPDPDLVDDCRSAGCSGQLCVPEDFPPVFTTCEWWPEYACYDTARCERQPSGDCGWTPTPELNACLDSY